MKSLHIIIFLFSSVYCNGQDRNKEDLTLIALKNNSKYIYRLGTPVRVKFLKEGNKTIKQGRLSTVTTSGIYLSSFKRKDTIPSFISLDSILEIKKLLRKQRTIVSILSMAAFGVIAGSTAKEDTYFPPVVGAALFSVAIAVYGNLCVYLVESLSEKRIKKGWTFKIQ